jgi:hypothetical protein
MHSNVVSNNGYKGAEWMKILYILVCDMKGMLEEMGKGKRSAGVQTYMLSYQVEASSA